MTRNKILALSFVATLLIGAVMTVAIPRPPVDVDAGINLTEVKATLITAKATKTTPVASDTAPTGATAPTDATPQPNNEVTEAFKKRSEAIMAKYAPTLNQIKADGDALGQKAGLGKALEMRVQVDWTDHPVSLDVPQVTKHPKTLSLDLPQMTMKRHEFSFDLPEVTMGMQWVLGIKTKVPEVRMVTHRFSFDIPEFRMETTSFTLDVPEVTMKRMDAVISIPEFTLKDVKLFGLTIKDETLRSEAEALEARANAVAAQINTEMAALLSQVPAELSGNTTVNGQVGTVQQDQQAKLDAQYAPMLAQIDAQIAQLASLPESLRGTVESELIKAKTQLLASLTENKLRLGNQSAG